MRTPSSPRIGYVARPLSFVISPSIAAGIGCSRKIGWTPFSQRIFFFASSTVVQPSFASTVIGWLETERIAAMFSSSFARPILTLSFGNAAASFTFCLMTSAVSIPIENVVTGIPCAGTPRISWTGRPSRLPFQSQSAMSSAATTSWSFPAASSAFSRHVRWSHGERPATAFSTRANAASDVSQLWLQRLFAAASP